MGFINVWRGTTRFQFQGQPGLITVYNRHSIFLSGCIMKQNYRYLGVSCSTFLEALSMIREVMLPNLQRDFTEAIRMNEGGILYNVPTILI